MWPVSNPVWSLAGALLVGWVWGSFLNQVVDRTPFRDGKRPGGTPSEPVTLLRPMRSQCFACGVPIPWHDNLPVVSFLILRGRCRRCSHPIGLRTLIVEGLVPLAFGGLALMLIHWRASPFWWLWSPAALSWVLTVSVAACEYRKIGRGLSLLGALLALALLLV